MAQDVLAGLMRDVLMVSTILLLPPLVTALLIGLAISIVQAITSIQEQTLTFVPKIVTMALVMAVLGNWMLRTLVKYSYDLFAGLAQYGAL